MESVEAATSSAAPRIRVLPSQLVDQIAAGEVVERPASVVKELVENAIDAGARRVDVTIDGGGRRLIRVVDDGCGMTAEEARLALARHATSKISAADDLFALTTFGFRGEALPSIASVSRLTLSTKTRAAVAGLRLMLEGGREAEAREVGIPDGTQIEVRDLFFNTPARLKFLKAEATETANVSEAVLRLALAHPEVHLRLRQGDRVSLDLPAERDRGARVRAALARRGAGILHEALGEENAVRVQAFVAAPEEAQSSPRSTFLFVGRRFVRDRSLLSALSMAYGELLDRGRYPLGALFVDVPGPDVDVNVHPQKLEVRFANAQMVYGAVRHVVAAALARAPWLSSNGSLRTFSLPPEPARPDAGTKPGRALGRDRGGVPSGPLLWQPGFARAGATTVLPGLSFGRGPSEAGSLGASTARDGDAPPASVTTGLGDPGLSRDLPVQGAASPKATFFSSLRLLGQLHKTYLVCEGPGELVLVDQHAAHERVAFQRLRRAHGQRAVPRQRLLFPLRVEIGEAATAALRSGEHAATLSGLGFDVEPFGASELVVRAVPEPLREADPKPLLLDVLGQLGDDGRTSALEAKLDEVLATMACHSVVRAGDVLSSQQALALLGELDDVDLRSHCPHGRPVLLRLPTTEIERRFGRT